MNGADIHELVFTDRAARPAKWQTRCGRTDVPVEHTMTPAPHSHYSVTCDACLAAATGAAGATQFDLCAAEGIAAVEAARAAGTLQPLTPAQAREYAAALAPAGQEDPAATDAA